MADPAHHELLGYLLEALDDSEREAIWKKLQDDPCLQTELDRLRLALAPLEVARRLAEPPPRLAERTCRMVFEHTESPAAVAGSEAAQRRPSPTRRLRAMRAESQLGAGRGRRASWLDMAVAGAMIGAAFLLVFPAIQATRENARRNACGENLSRIGQSLAQYSETFSGYFPYIPVAGRLAVAGAYAPMLKSAQLLPDPSRLICPVRGVCPVRGATCGATQTPIEVPTVAQLVEMPEGPELEQVRQGMGGSYGFSFGYVEGGRYRGLRNLGRSSFALMSDAPDPRLPGCHSLNHGDGGQNVLFEAGNLRYVVTPTLAGGRDNFFLNDVGLVGAGMHRNDSVIGSSGAVPILYTGGSR